MGFADTERNRAAVHEAGHALVATSRGLVVAVIELHSNDGEGGMRLCKKPSELDRVWVLYGGPFAEKVVFRRLPSVAISPELDELLLAHRLCRQIGINDTIGIRDHVEAYLRGRQARLELVASRLLETGMVQGAELDELLREERGMSPRRFGKGGGSGSGSGGGSAHSPDKAETVNTTIGKQPERIRHA